jgi:CubicO group peptidase (beta-lactamase class C family)
MGIARVEWQRAANGVPYAASGLRLTPRDMAKIGRMMVQGGKWEGRQLVSATWTKAAITPHARVQPDLKCGTQYGYFWWLYAGCQLTPPLAWASAVGNGGQRIVIVPDQDIVVVLTSGLYNSRTQSQATNVIPAVLAAMRKPAAP